MQKLFVSSVLNVGKKALITLTNDALDITIHVKDPKISLSLKQGEKISVSDVLKLKLK